MGSRPAVSSRRPTTTPARTKPATTAPIRRRPSHAAAAVAAKSLGGRTVPVHIPGDFQRFHPPRRTSFTGGRGLIRRRRESTTKPRAFPGWADSRFVIRFRATSPRRSSIVLLRAKNRPREADKHSERRPIDESCRNPGHDPYRGAGDDTGGRPGADRHGTHRHQAGRGLAKTVHLPERGPGA